MKIGDYLRQQREKSRLTMRELAERGQYDHTYLSKIENGRMAPSPALLEFYAAQPELEVDLDRAFQIAGRVPPDVVELLRGRPAWWVTIRNAAHKTKQGGER